MIIYVEKVNPNTFQCAYKEPEHEGTLFTFVKELN